MFVRFNNIFLSTISTFGHGGHLQSDRSIWIHRQFALFVSFVQLLIEFHAVFARTFRKSSDFFTRSKAISSQNRAQLFHFANLHYLSTYSFQIACYSSSPQSEFQSFAEGNDHQLNILKIPQLNKSLDL